MEKLGYWSLLSLPLSTAAIRRLEITIGLVRTLTQPYLIRFFAPKTVAFSFISHEMITGEIKNIGYAKFWGANQVLREMYPVDIFY